MEATQRFPEFLAGLLQRALRNFIRVNGNFRTGFYRHGIDRIGNAESASSCSSSTRNALCIRYIYEDYIKSGTCQMLRVSLHGTCVFL